MFLNITRVFINMFRCVLHNLDECKGSFEYVEKEIIPLTGREGP
jgi:hypothetical protein